MVGTNAVVFRSATTTIAQHDVFFSGLTVAGTEADSRAQAEHLFPPGPFGMGQEATIIGTPTVKIPKTRVSRSAGNRYMESPIISL